MIKKLISNFKNKSFKNFFTYMFAEVINKSVPFLMLPVFTRYLTPADYGIVASFTTLQGILEIFVGLSVQGAISVNYFVMPKEKLKVFIANSMLILVVTFLIVNTIIFFLRGYIFSSLLIPERWSIICVSIALMNYVTSINMALWRCEQKARLYSYYQISQTLVNVGLSAIFIIIFDMGWSGRLVAIGFSYFIFSIFSFFLLVKRGFFKFEFELKYIKQSLAFGIPYIPHSLSGWIKRGIDRVIIINLLGAVITGLYSVGYQFGMIIGLFSTAFNRAWSPNLYNRLSNNPTLEQKKIIVKQIYWYCIFLLVTTAVFNVFVVLFMDFFIGKNFADSKKYVLWISLSYAFNGMYTMVVNFIIFSKKTKVLASITFIISIFHALICYLLVRLNGALGAAQASAISFFINFVIVLYTSNKIYPMPWRIKFSELFHFK